MPQTRRSRELHPERNTRVSSYQCRIERRLTDIYFEVPSYVAGRTHMRGDEEWEFVAAGHTHGYATCELCGHNPIRRLFWVRSRSTGREIMMGSECVVNYASADLVRGYLSQVTRQQGRNRQRAERARQEQERQEARDRVITESRTAWDAFPRRAEVEAFLTNYSGTSPIGPPSGYILSCRSWLQNRGYLSPVQYETMCRVIDEQAATLATRTAPVSETPASPFSQGISHNAERGELPEILDAKYSVREWGSTFLSPRTWKFQIHTVSSGQLSGKRIIKVERDGMYRGFAFLTTTPGVKTWSSCQSWVTPDIKVAARSVVDACVANAWPDSPSGFSAQITARDGCHYRVTRTDVVAAPQGEAEIRVSSLDGNGRIPPATEGPYSVTGRITMTEPQEATIRTYVRRHPLAMSAHHPEIVR